MVGPMKILAVLAILLSLAAESPAKVLVYKGAITSKTGPVGLRPSPLRCFMVFDPDSKQIEFVSLFRRDGDKVLDVSSPIAVQVASVEVLQGKTATTISLNTGSVSEPPTFSNGLLYLRGTDATLRVASSGITTSNQPRVLSGFNVQTGFVQGIGAFVEQKITLVYQEQRSIRANDANKSINEVAQSLGEELTLKGFEEE
jgi:hypothetical protein